MAALSFGEATPEQIAAIADGLMLSKHYGTAAKIYEIALSEAKVGQNAIRTRLGLAQSPNAGTPAMFDMLMELERRSANVFVGDGLATWFKTLPFFDDERFTAIAKKHAGLLPMANWHWNLQTVLWAVQETRDVPGDLVELGVFKGHTTLFVAEYVDFQDWPKTWHLYDTFDGIPADQVDPGWEKANQETYVGTFSKAEVAASFAHVPNIRVIKGRVPEILSQDCPDRISFLHVDLNNATAEIQALDALFERVSPGGIIVFDDFGWATARAQHDAEKAWFAARGLRILPLPTGQGLFVKRATASQP